MADTNSTTEVTTRRCVKCGETKPLTEFYTRKNRWSEYPPRKPCSYCKACVRGITIDHYHQNKDSIGERTRMKMRAIRAEMIAAYGGTCACCGESAREFLTIDHVNGGGSRHSKSLGGGGRAVLMYLYKLGWPKDGYRLLCYNCNSGRERFGGVCPHEKSPEWPDLVKPKWAPPESRLCVRCGVTKPNAEFFRHAGRPGSYCKPCAVVLRLQHYHLARKMPSLPDVPGGLGYFGRCSRCELWKVKSEGFHKGQGWCKSCSRQGRLDRLEKANATARVRDRRQIRRVLEAFGAVCVCCGEREMGFLTIDHIHGGGTRERKQKGTKGSLYGRVWRQGCPRDKYRILCFNCNCSIGILGRRPPPF